MPDNIYRKKGDYSPLHTHNPHACKSCFEITVPSLVDEEK